MTPFQIQMLLTGMVVFAMFIAGGIILHTRLYRFYGYPPQPACLKQIRLSDDIPAIHAKIEPLLEDGFQITQHDLKTLRLEKRFTEPPSQMTIEFIRPQGHRVWCSTRIEFTCHRPFMNWSSQTGTHSANPRSMPKMRPGNASP